MYQTRGTIILLCNLTMNMAQPWIDAGYRAVLIDPQHGADRDDGIVECIAGTVLEAGKRLSQIIRTENVVFVAGFPPCTDVAVSGSRWFASKAAADPHFQSKAALVAEQCRMVGVMAGCPWFFENPVSVFSSIFGKAQYGFHPWHFTGYDENDNYTKQTQLWASDDFSMPSLAVHPSVEEAIIRVKEASGGKMVSKSKAIDATGNDPLVVEWYPDNRIHQCPPGDERANFRSATPCGFAKAVFLANAPHLHALTGSISEPAVL